MFTSNFAFCFNLSTCPSLGKCLIQNLTWCEIYYRSMWKRILTVYVEFPPVFKRTVWDKWRSSSTGQDLATVLHSRHKGDSARRHIPLETCLEHGEKRTHLLFNAEHVASCSYSQTYTKTCRVVSDFYCSLIYCIIAAMQIKLCGKVDTNGKVLLCLTLFFLPL